MPRVLDRLAMAVAAAMFGDDAPILADDDPNGPRVGPQARRGQGPVWISTGQPSALAFTEYLLLSKRTRQVSSTPRLPWRGSHLEGACQESCVEGRLQLNPLLCGEPFAEHDGELRLGGGPFAWRHLPLAADLAQHQEQQLGCRFVIGEVATAAHCGA